jgi:hypothetical protein
MLIGVVAAREALAAVVLLFCIGLGVWLGLRTSVRLGYRQPGVVDRKIVGVVLWLVFVCAAAVGLFYAVK